MKRSKKDFMNIFSNSAFQFDEKLNMVQSIISNKNPQTRAGLVNIDIFNNINNRFYTGNYNKNKESINDMISLYEARHTDGYIHRPLWNLQHKMVADDFSFYIKNKDDKKADIKIKLMKDYFTAILNNSGYTTEAFFDELSHNIHYSNIFIHKKNDYVRGITLKLTIMPFDSWFPLKMNGLSVTEWRFKPSRNNPKFAYSLGHRDFSFKNIIHLTFNKDTQDIYGVPLLKSALDDTSLLRELENADAANYIDSTNRKPIIFVGDKEKGAQQTELESVENYIAKLSPDKVPVISKRAEFSYYGPDRIEGGNIQERFKERLISSTGGSKTSFGSSVAGRQSAEADTDSDDKTVQSLQQKLSNQLNQKIFMQLNYELFGELTEHEMVFIKAKENFNTLERKEKHHSLLWTSGAIDKEEYEKRMNFKLDEKKVYPNLVGSSNNGMLSNLSNPTNQYGKTGTSKKSKKD